MADQHTGGGGLQWRDEECKADQGQQQVQETTEGYGNLFEQECASSEAQLHTCG